MRWRKLLNAAFGTGIVFPGAYISGVDFWQRGPAGTFLYVFALLGALLGWMRPV